jgi:hypothetical protein
MKYINKRSNYKNNKKKKEKKLVAFVIAPLFELEFYNNLILSVI